MLDFGEGRLASIATGFTIQKYRSPAVELCGSTGNGTDPVTRPEHALR